MWAVFAERTRVEKTGTKNGFDWIIMNLALAQNWIPARLHRNSRTKTDAEFGVDFAFLLRQLYGRIVETVLSMAATRDLAQRGLEDVREVEVILAYNQDENADGVLVFRQQ
jgi:hypothetical protein